MRKLLLTLLTCCALVPAVQAETLPEDLVRSTADVILAEIKKNRDQYAKDNDKLYRMAEEKVLPHFDFRRMSQWVLGRFWREASAEQRDRFVKEFRDLLVATYSIALLSYKDQEIVYLPVQHKPNEDDVLVKTEVKQGGGQPNIPIHYSFYKNSAGQWKVYDIIIEGVSIVTNYRSVYATKIREQGMDALINEVAANNRNKRASGKKS
jgi:phospholipid transport system substrate-binding protein